MVACLFCKMVAGELPVTPIYEDDLSLSFFDISPQAPFHALIIPKIHYESVVSMADNPSLSGHLVSVCTKIAKQHHLTDSGFRIITNIGQDGGQSVYHVHFHLLGGRSMSWPPG